MFDAQSSAENPPNEAPDRVAELAGETAQARAARQLRMLRDLSEIGMRLIQGIERQVLAQGRLQDVAEQAGVTEVVGGSVTLEFRGDPARAYDRITRAMRLNTLLELRIVEDETARPARALAAARAAAKAAETARAEAARLRRRDEDLAESAAAWARADAVIDVVEITLEAEGLDREVFWPRLAPIVEEMTLHGGEYDCRNQSTGALIALICKTFDVTPDWSLWADQDWAIEETRARTPGSPYADWNGPPGEGDADPAGPAPEVAAPAGASP